MSVDTVRPVPVEDWRSTAGSAVDDGYDYLDLLAGTDRIDRIEVVLRVLRSQDPAGPALRLVTAVPVTAGRLASLTPVLPAANWHERELAEMLGVRFDGHPNPRALLLRQPGGAPPLLRSTVLAARVARAWPGAAGAGEDRRGPRRRQAPPGVPAQWLAAGR